MAQRNGAPAKKAPRASSTPKTAPAQKATKPLTPTAAAPSRSPGQDKLNAIGVEEICSKLRSGGTLSACAKEFGVSIALLIDWIGADPERSARTREARSQGAACYDEQAQKLIEDADDPLALAKARELAQHLRWRASKLNPRQYGEKLEMSGVLDIKTVTDDELQRKAAMLMGLLTTTGSVSLPENRVLTGANTTGSV